MIDPQDHRVSKRVDVNLQVEIKAGDTTFDGSVLNCSLSGIFLRTPQKLEEYDQLEITIRLPGLSEPMNVVSRVIWTDWADPKQSPGFGIHFVSLTDEQAALLRTYLYE